jgi:hypothetical protein
MYRRAIIGWERKTSLRKSRAAPASLRKWPSLKNERSAPASWGATSYLVVDGTLDECLRQFMSKPASQHHLYEIHTAPRSDLVSAVLSENILFSSPGCGIFSKVYRHDERGARAARSGRSPSIAEGFLDDGYGEQQ